MKTDAHVLGCEPGFWVVSCCSRHIRITTRTQQTLMLLIISELTQNRIWISECIYELYVYIFNPYPILVRSAYYYVAKCWRAPRTCLQSWQTTQSRDLLFMYMRCVPYNLPYWLCLSPHPKPSCRWCRWSTVMATMKKTRYLKINTFMQHKPIPSLLHIKNRMRIRNIHTNYRCILFYHIRFSLFYY